MDILTHILTEAYNNKDLKVSYHFNNDYNEKLQSPTLDLNHRPNFNNLLNENMTEKDLSSILGRKWKALLGNLGSFIDLYQYIVTTKNYTPYVISTTGRRLNKIYKNQSAVSRVITLAEKVGLLYCSFQNSSSYLKLAKEYYYNKQVERVIRKLVERYDINYKRVIKNSRVNKDENNSDIDIGSRIRNNDYKVKFSSKLRISHMTDDEVLDAIYNKYPTLDKYQKLFDDMNEKYLLDYPEQQVMFSPKITRTDNGYVSKIGIRATSGICNLKVHENDNKEYTGKWRDEYLDEIFGKDNWYENDVKSSVPRVAYLMKTGNWLDQDIDMYEVIFKTFENAGERKVYKNFFMKFYFDEENQLYNHNRDYFPETIETFGKEECNNALKLARTKMVSILGETVDSEIFFHESCIYGIFANFLRSKGIKVVQIYDAVFSDVDTSVYNDVLKDIAEEYYREYIKSISNRDEDNNSDIDIGVRIRNNDREEKEITLSISDLADLALSLSRNVNIENSNVNKGE